MNNLGKILGALQEQERFMELELRNFKNNMAPTSPGERLRLEFRQQLLTEANIRVQDAITRIVAVINANEP